jgi:hypothetical protein
MPIDAETTEAPEIPAWVDAAEVGPEVARAAWTPAARDVLIGIAGKYHAVITFKELAASVQETTGIRTKQMMHHWVGDVLGRVAADCVSRDEPLLSALCVTADGSVGDGYAVVVTTVRGTAPADGDDHAALERLACYKFFGANIPAGGGNPALTARLSARRTRLRKIAHEERVIPLCSKCQIAVPPSGICDNCD